MRLSSLMALAAFVAMLPGSSVHAVTLQVGDILVTDDEAGRILKIDPVTGAQTIVSAEGHLVAPVGIAVEADRQLVVSDPSARAVIRIDPATGAQTVVSSGAVGRGIAVEADGNLVATDFVLDDELGDVLISVDRVPVGEGVSMTTGAGGGTSQRPASPGFPQASYVIRILDDSHDQDPNAYDARMIQASVRGKYRLPEVAR